MSNSGECARGVGEAVSAAVAQSQFGRLTEFFTYPGWNKRIEYVADKILHIAVTRQADGVKHLVHCSTITTDGLLGPMDMFALMAAMSIDNMVRCDGAKCHKHGNPSA